MVMPGALPDAMPPPHAQRNAAFAMQKRRDQKTKNTSFVTLKD
jgi:hypothetical protein